MLLKLAQKYSKSVGDCSIAKIKGRVEDANKFETELQRLLTYADADHPILIQLRRVQGK